MCVCVCVCVCACVCVSVCISEQICFATGSNLTRDLRLNSKIQYKLPSSIQQFALSSFILELAGHQMYVKVCPFGQTRRKNITRSAHLRGILFSYPYTLAHCHPQYVNGIPRKWAERVMFSRPTRPLDLKNEIFDGLTISCRQIYVFYDSSSRN